LLVVGNISHGRGNWLWTCVFCEGPAGANWAHEVIRIDIQQGQLSRPQSRVGAYAAMNICNIAQAGTAAAGGQRNTGRSTPTTAAEKRNTRKTAQNRRGSTLGGRNVFSVGTKPLNRGRRTAMRPNIILIEHGLRRTYNPARKTEPQQKPEVHKHEAEGLGKNNRPPAGQKNLPTRTKGGQE